MVFGDEITVTTKGFSDIVDLTSKVSEIVRRSQVTHGLVYVFVIGSTASVSTIEFEPALVQDMKDQLEKFASQSMASRHGATWGDDNGFSHLRATFMGPGVTIPISNREMVLGTWQQVVLIDHDNRGRERRIFVQALGE